jgi:cell division protein FtsB
MVAYWVGVVRDYPIVSIEDGMSESDRAGWIALTAELSERILLVGDDVFVTNPEILAAGIADGIGNALLVKLNQVGTVTETLEAVRLAQGSGYKAVVSHRSGETTDDSIADLSVAVNAGLIKAGIGLAGGAAGEVQPAPDDRRGSRRNRRLRRREGLREMTAASGEAPRGPRPFKAFLVSLGVSTVLLCVLLFSDRRVFELADGRARIRQLDAEIADKERENRDLQAQLEAASKHEFPAERIAREELQLVGRRTSSSSIRLGA